jgi:hypothetical protein
VLRVSYKIDWGNDMLDMTVESTETVLGELLATCADTETIASQLAAQVRQESLRTLLQQRAHAYGRAAAELLRHVAPADADSADGLLRIKPEGEVADVESMWEAIECSALICFRDALDAGLPADLHAAVRRWIEDGVSALEHLRSLALQRADSRRQGPAVTAARTRA